MATKIKYTRKELKGPDKFSSTVIAGFEYFSDHSKKIVLVVGAVIVVLVAAYAINRHGEGNQDKAATMFTGAVEKYNAGDLNGAVTEFLALKSAYPDAKITKIALYYAGLINFKLGKYDESINELDEFLNSGVKEDMLIQSALLTQGLARFEQGNWQQAVEFLSQFQKMPDGPLRDRANVHLAMAYEKMGQPQKAKEIYREMNKAASGMNRGLPPVSVNTSVKAKTN